VSDLYRAGSSRRRGGLTTDNLKPRKRIFKVTHSNGVLRRMEPKSQTPAHPSALLQLLFPASHPGHPASTPPISPGKRLKERRWAPRSQI
jgi:hypothetical protein